MFAADCIYEAWDEDKEFATCPVCLTDYAECNCPDPSMEDEYYYKEVEGILYAKKK